MGSFVSIPTLSRGEFMGTSAQWRSPKNHLGYCVKVRSYPSYFAPPPHLLHCQHSANLVTYSHPYHPHTVFYTLPTNSYVSIFITHTINRTTKHNTQDGAQKASYLPLPTLQWQLIFDPPKTMAAPFLISLLMLPPTTFITAITFIDVSYHEGHHYFIIFLPPPSHPLPSL